MEDRPQGHEEVMKVLRTFLAEEYSIAIQRASQEKLSRLYNLLDKIALEILIGK